MAIKLASISVAMAFAIVYFILNQQEITAAGARMGARFWPSAAPTLQATSPVEEQVPVRYRHPMNPTIFSPVPAKDNMGMDYIPVYEDDDPDESTVVRIAPAVVNNLGVRTEQVTRGELSRRIDTVGYIGYDERKISHVHVRTAGWVENLRAQATGDRVRKGALLFEFYSPDLVNAQREYLQASRLDQPQVLPASKERLLALGIPSVHIKRLDDSRSARQRVPVYAPQDGIVARLDIREGMYIKPESELLTLANPASVWVLVDVFERQADWVAVGQKAQVRLPYLPGEIWAGEVEYIYPDLDPKTRTLKVRLRFDNPGERLKINMYANVTIHSSPRENALSVPTDALIRSGDTQRVIVAKGDGRFEPVEVQSGIESGDRIEILAGLENGDTVVVSGQFLIDSEANLRAGLRRLTEPSASEVWGEGVVGEVNANERTAKLSHGPIAALGWPAMTMDFRLAESIDADLLRPGAKVRFALEQSPAGYVIVSVKPAGDGAGSLR